MSDDGSDALGGDGAGGGAADGFTTDVTTDDLMMEFCDDRYDEDLFLFNMSMGLSLMYTTVTVCLYKRGLENAIDGAPKMASQFFFVIGFIQILIGVGLWTICLPSCPEGCSCNVDDLMRRIPPPPLYPIVAVMVGVVWLCRSYGYWRLNRRLLSSASGDDADAVVGAGDADGAVFDKVSTVELEEMT